MRSHAKVLVAVTALFMLLLPSAAQAAPKAVSGFLGNTSGSADGQFNTPRAAAVNSSGADTIGTDTADAGDIYVVDASNNRVQLFSAAGTFKLKFGASGAGAAQLSTPTGIAVDQASGAVYVFDQGNRRVAKYDADGTFLFAFGAGVADNPTPGPQANALQSCSATCFQGLNSSADGGFGTTTSAPSLAVVPAGAPNAGDVIVADSGNATTNGRRIQAFSAPGTAGPAVLRAKVGAAGTGDGQFGATSPTRVAVDDAGRVYAVDNGNNRIQRFTYSEGPPALAFDTVYGATQLSGSPAPTNIAIDPGALSAGDASDDRVFAVKPCNSTLCPSGSLPPPFSTSEMRIKELGTAADPSLIETHMPGSGITSANGLALNTTNERLFLSSTTGGQRLYTVEEVTAPVATVDPVVAFDATSATFSGEVDANSTRSDYRFEYSTNGSTWTCIDNPTCTNAANLKDAGSGANPVEVSSEVKVLVPDTHYFVRLQAIKPFGAGTDIDGPVEFDTDAAAPEAITGFVAPRSTTTARLNGNVNPNNQQTDYWFEYGTEGPCSNPANECESTDAVDAGSTFIPASQAPPLVSAELEGLAPGTTYHYRFLAENDTGETAGEDSTFKTRTVAEMTIPPNAFGQANRRGIELVNNPDKGNQHAFLRPLETTSMGRFVPFSADGKKVVWTVNAGAPGLPSGGGGAFLAERGGDGWDSHSLIPPAAQQVGGGALQYQLENGTFTPDLSHFVFRASQSEGPVPIGTGQYVRVDGQQNQDVLGIAGTEIGNTGLTIDITRDGSHVVVLTGNQLLDGTGDGPPEVVSIMPGGAPASCNLDLMTENASAYRYHFIATTDASRVYFIAAPNGECSTARALWVRNRTTGETTMIDRGASGTSGIIFIRATPDGRNAFFTTTSQLDPADQNSGRDIYRWDEDTESSTCLTCVVPNASVLHSAGQSSPYVLVSDDSSHVYFRSDSKLIADPRASEGGLYALSNDTLRFVTKALVPVGESSGFIGRAGQPQLSPDGNVLTFRAKANSNLTTDAVGPQCIEPILEDALGTDCVQYYRYDDRDGSMECVSCVADGVTTYTIGFGGNTFLSSSGGGAQKASDDGNTLAFATIQRLVPRDVNNGADIYEWRNGALRLVTDGVTEFKLDFSAPQVWGVNSDGSSILFQVAQPGLTRFEQDGFSNVYVARIGGGFEPPSRPVFCSEDSCQGPLQAAPPEDQPASSALHGRGNLTAAPAKRCARNSVKRGKRCVRKRALAKRSCKAKKGKAKQRCVNKQKGRLNREAKANSDAGRNK